MRLSSIIFVAFLAVSLSACEGQTSDVEPDVIEPAKENDNDTLFGIWEREYLAGKTQYTFEAPARFLKKTFEGDSTSSMTCSQGFFQAKEGILYLYSRGGNGGWNIEIQPYAIDGSAFTLAEVYQNPLAGETGGGEWRTFEEKYQILSETALDNPCEILGQQSTPDSLCCADALAGVSPPEDNGDWPLTTQTEGVLLLNPDGTSQFDWAKMDSSGNVYIDRKSGRAEINAQGTWANEEEGVTVSDENASKRYKRISPSTMYEDSSSYLFKKL